jgi:sigma-E factor negative regulatory protein RseC
MEEIGIVKNVDGVNAKVLVERKSACDKCTEGKCLVTDGGAIIDALNLAKAEVGQRVRVVFKPYTYLKGSILIYGIPALALIAGAVIGKEFLGDIIKIFDPDLLSAISGFGLFIIAFIAVRLLTKRLERKSEYKPVIEEILEMGNRK